MALMDDVFDLRAALKGKPEAELFDRIENAMWTFENQRDAYNEKLVKYQLFEDLIRDIVKE